MTHFRVICDSNSNVRLKDIDIVDAREADIENSIHIIIKKKEAEFLRILS